MPTARMHRVSEENEVGKHVIQSMMLDRIFIGKDQLGWDASGD